MCLIRLLVAIAMGCFAGVVVAAGLLMLGVPGAQTIGAVAGVAMFIFSLIFEE